MLRFLEVKPCLSVKNCVVLWPYKVACKCKIATVQTKFVGDAKCYNCITIPVTRFQRGLIKTFHAGSVPRRKVMRAEHATFSMHSGACAQTEPCPPKLLRGFDSTEKEGPSLPGVWYNESELAKHDLQLPQKLCLKRLQTENSTTNSTDSSLHMHSLVKEVCVGWGWRGGGGSIICFIFYVIEYRTSPGFLLCLLSFRTRAGNTAFNYFL